MSRTMLTLAISVTFVYLGLCAALFIFQRSLIYFPQPRSLDRGVVTITLQVDEAKMLVTTRPHNGPNALIYFGGNAADAYLLPRQS
jgi:hypothetical protein